MSFIFRGGAGEPPHFVAGSLLAPTSAGVFGHSGWNESYSQNKIKEKSFIGFDLRCIANGKFYFEEEPSKSDVIPNRTCVSNRR
ncbi:hypothetical protein EBO34_00295 [Alteribacter keqinensis]|uniref:Uncharacterized protein n=1 Tax=Alteribacter keqinensis TaxID=2483800 RepID=A0A3M7TTY6_9BACI|nr:hypothetical protein EBO34_00295 [Alteribacter keqinensis]